MKAVARPVVSIVVPVYNVAAYLRACVESLQAQTTTSIEILLVDDGSTDGSGADCDALAAQDLRIRVVHQANQGLAAARNAGIELARGEYLVFVDSDDVVAPDYVWAMLQLARAHDADIVVTGFTPFTDAAPEYRRGGSVAVETARQTLHRIVCQRMQIEAVAKLFRRELIVQAPRFPVGLLYEDLYFTPRIFAFAGTCVYSSDQLYGYRLRPGSIMSTTRLLAIAPDLITILDADIEHAEQTFAEPERGALVRAYALHASKALERLPLRSWRRNRPFRDAYADFARRHFSQVAADGELSPAYRALWGLSRHSPLAFRLVTGLGHRAKRRGMVGLRRGR